jgi:chemotaxis response regulator CheB
MVHQSDPQIHIVAIGASADGIEAISTLLQDLLITLRAAVLVVLHRPPNYSSSLPEILARETGLHVVVPKEEGAPSARFSSVLKVLQNH